MAIEVAAFAKTITGVGAAFVVLWGGVQVADTRYEQKAVHETEHSIIQTGMDNFSLTILKKEIRELREIIAHEDDPAHAARLQLDLQDAIDRLCRFFPEDRECRG
jgi:hypothetical protein